MTIAYIILTVYLLIAIGFLVAIQLENIKYDADFSFFQVIVALLWFPWGIWYLSVIASEWIRNRNARR